MAYPGDPGAGQYHKEMKDKVINNLDEDLATVLNPNKPADI